MTGKCYYLETLGAWRRHGHRFAKSHFVVLVRGALEFVDFRQGGVQGRRRGRARGRRLRR